MTADSSYAAETTSSEAKARAYISPTADFAIISVFMLSFAAAGAAIILP